MRNGTELGKVLLALLWLPLACVVYMLAFGVQMLKSAAIDGWDGF